MIKLAVIFGTRPEAIKLCPLIKGLYRNKDKVETTVIVSGQHREMLHQILNIFDVIPDYDLDVMEPNQDLSTVTNKILNGVTMILKKITPDMIIVQGDTTTTFAASLAAFYQKISISHVEAGLRTNNIYSPFPEEINRRMTTLMSKLHFAPTENSKNNLQLDGVNKNNIFVVGNTVIDALKIIDKNLDLNSEEQYRYYKTEYGIDFKNNKRKLLVTSHRRESFGIGFNNICNAISSIAKDNDVEIIYPVHLNPNVKNVATSILSDKDNIFLIPPQDYINFIYLMKNSYLIMTDSGGVQEEAPSLNKPLLVMRETTEREEVIIAKCGLLTGVKIKDIVENTNNLLRDQDLYDIMSNGINPYGDGQASEKIINILISEKYINM